MKQPCIGWWAVAFIYSAALVASVSCTRDGQYEDPLLVFQAVREEEALADLGQHEGSGVLDTERAIPETPEPWQKRPPCDRGHGEVVIRGACWVPTIFRPPCGKLYTHPAPKESGIKENICWRAVVAPKKEPSALEQ